MLEENVENYLRNRVKDLGGFCIKLDPTGYKGIPDRLIVLPGVIAFVELKRPKGGVVAKLQHWWKKKLGTLGAPSYIVPSVSEVDELLHVLARDDGRFRQGLK